MNKKGESNKNNLNIKVSKKLICIFLFIIVLIIPILIVILKINSNTIITSDNEYWVADMEVKIDNIENNQYKYTKGAKLYGFYSNNKCEILTMNLEQAENGSDILTNKTFYDENLKEFIPTGAWVSYRSSACTYERKKDSIVLNVSEAGKDYTLVGTYKVLKNNLMLISWTNNDLTNVSYSKVKLNEYIDDFYMYGGKIDPKFYIESKNITVNVNELDVYYLGEAQEKYIGMNDLISYLKDKYKIDIEKKEFGYLNIDNAIEYIYHPSQNYVLYEMKDDVINIKLPLRTLSENEIAEKIKKTNTNTKAVQDVKMQVYDYSGNLKYYNYYLLYHFNTLEEYKNAYYIGTTMDLD